MSKSYEPSPTVLKFLWLNNRVQLLLGPIGGGKTVGVLMKLLMLANQQAPNANNERCTRWGVVRNTRPQLRDSVLKTVMQWLPADGTRVVWREADMTLILDYFLEDGTRVKSELLFRALDREEDAQRLLSVEYTGIWLSEFREIPFKLLTDALSRTGRYPSAADGGPTWHGILGESNMPAQGSDWHNYLEVKLPSYAQRLIQPSALSAEAENLKNLKPDYYTVLMEGSTEAWQKAHILCEYPDSLEGKAVFGNTFKRDRHVRKGIKSINIGTHSPTILMGVDQGRSPAVLFGQLGGSGRLSILGELFTTNCGMEKFGREHIWPYVNTHFAGMPILAVIDPAGFHKNEVNDITPADALRGIGFRVMPAPTNDPERRIEAVERLMLLADGLLISEDNCPTLIRAIASEYQYKIKKNNQTDDRPEKLHPWSDLADCLQYICLIAGGNNYGKVMSRVMGSQGGKQTVRKAPPPASGWT